MKNFNFLFFGFMTIAFLVIPFQEVNAVQKMENKEVAKKENFINLFIERQKKGDGAGDLRGIATNFIKECCENRDDALQMLLDNGFKINSKIYEPDEYYDRGFGKEHYDEIIFGKRGTSTWRFWDILAVYRVTLYINDNKVDWVSAKVERTFP